MSPINPQYLTKKAKRFSKTNELEENSVISILETTATDGKNYKTSYYSLGYIIAIGYRVNSINKRNKSGKIATKKRYTPTSTIVLLIPV